MAFRAAAGEQGVVGADLDGQRGDVEAVTRRGRARGGDQRRGEQTAPAMCARALHGAAMKLSATSAVASPVSTSFTRIAVAAFSTQALSAGVMPAPCNVAPVT